MKTMKYIFAVLLCLAVIAAMGAPVTAAPAAPPATYSGDKLQANYPYSFDQTWKATIDALQARNLKIMSMNKDPEGKRGDITIMTKQGPTLDVRLMPQGSDKTLVSIGGPESAARTINSMIAEQIGKA